MQTDLGPNAHARANRAKPHFTPRHLLPRLLFWLLIGAAVNLASTWALSAAKFSQRYNTFSESQATKWPVSVPSHWPPVAFHFQRTTWCSKIECWELNGAETRVDMYSWGFPFQSMMFYMLFEPRTSPQVHGAYTVWTPKPPYHVFPLRPMWPGFLANTLVHAVAAFILVRAFPFYRRWRRRRSGSCAACGYNLEGITSLVCPECGKAVPLPQISAK